jgi:biotin carboxyl carrier protein
MVRKFVVRVNGKEYVVEVEEVSSQIPQTQAVHYSQSAQSASVTSFSQPEQQVKVIQHSQQEVTQGVKPEKIQVASSGGSGFKVTAPMSGVILRVLVSEGQRVEYGQKIVILEAMKMENEIVTDKPGVVKKILVKEGDNVDTGQPLVEIE